MSEPVDRDALFDELEPQEIFAAGSTPAGGARATVVGPSLMTSGDAPHGPDRAASRTEIAGRGVTIEMTSGNARPVVDPEDGCRLTSLSSPATNCSPLPGTSPGGTAAA